MVDGGRGHELHNLSQFAGYAQAGYGFVPRTKSGGDPWMQNEAGVIMHLKAKRIGLVGVSLAGDPHSRRMAMASATCPQPPSFACGGPVRPA
jgi:hypothetical protein